MRYTICFILGLSLLAIQGCGQRGSLYMPAKDAVISQNK